MKLASETLYAVTDLCQQHEMTDFFQICIRAVKDSMADMCLGYRVALLMDQVDMIESFERKIQDNASETLSSASFLECDRNIFKNILRLVHSGCEAKLIVDASMEWAKAECKRSGYNFENSEYLRYQLGEAINQIPFDRLSSKQFSKHIVDYKGFSKR